jgi:hypothetical protein
MPSYHQVPEHLSPPFVAEPSTFNGLHEPATQRSTNMLDFFTIYSTPDRSTDREDVHCPQAWPGQVITEPLDAPELMPTHATNNSIQYLNQSQASGTWFSQERFFPNETHQVHERTRGYPYESSAPSSHSRSKSIVSSRARARYSALPCRPPGPRNYENGENPRSRPQLRMSNTNDLTGYTPILPLDPSQQFSAQGSYHNANVSIGVSFSPGSLDSAIDHTLPESSSRATRVSPVTHHASASTLSASTDQPDEDASLVPLLDCFKKPEQIRLRRLLDRCMASSWLRNHEVEPEAAMVGLKKRSILLEFTSRSGKAAPFSCAFDKCGKTFDRKDRAIIHIRFRHLNHKPFPCGGYCGDGQWFVYCISFPLIFLCPNRVYSLMLCPVAPRDLLATPIASVTSTRQRVLARPGKRLDYTRILALKALKLNTVVASCTGKICRGTGSGVNPRERQQSIKGGLSTGRFSFKMVLKFKKAQCLEPQEYHDPNDIYAHSSLD